MLLQAAWILTVPPFRGSDEFDHVFRAAAVADGEFVADDWASDGRGLFVTVPRHIVEAAQFQCEGLDYTGPENCAPAGGTSTHVRAASGAGLYHPAYYWIVGSAAQPFDGAAALYAMRIATALLCLMFLGMAVWATTRSAAAGRRRAWWSRCRPCSCTRPRSLRPTVSRWRRSGPLGNTARPH